MVRTQADQVTLPSDCNLKRLPNPPGRISRQTGAVTDVESIDGLHQAADSLLQQVRVAEGVVPESFGNVGGESDIRGRQAVLVMDVAFMQPADGCVGETLRIAMITNELRHGPRLHGRPMLSQLGDMPNHLLYEIGLAVPKIREQLTLFFRR